MFIFIYSCQILLLNVVVELHSGRICKQILFKIFPVNMCALGPVNFNNFFGPGAAYCYTFLPHPQASCTLKEKRLHWPGGVSGRDGQS